MSLRAATTTAMSIVALLVVASVGALILGTTHLHSLAVSQRTATESVRATEELRVELLLLDRVEVIDERPPAARRMGELFRDVESYATSSEELRLVRQARAEVDAYLANPSPITLGTAFETLSTLTRLNIEEAHAAERHARDVDRIGNIVGVTAGLVLALGIALVIGWIRSYVLRPIRLLESAMREFAAGQRSSRAIPAGPAELRMMAARFNEMGEAIEREGERRQTFLAGVAHDLRNPISALHFALATVSPDAPLPPEPRVRSLFALASRQVERLTRMVGDIVDSASIEAGKVALRLGDHDLRDLVAESVALFDDVSPKHELVVSMPNEELFAQCDATRIAQVLNNLLSNAIKYSPEGGRVEVRVERSGPELSIQVRDEGIGITDAERRKIFEPFRRVGTSRESIPGVGLGLHAAQAIVQAHGGRIEVVSELAKGSTFRVVLPERPAPSTIGADAPAGELVTAS